MRRFVVALWPQDVKVGFSSADTVPVDDSSSHLWFGDVFWVRHIRTGAWATGVILLGAIWYVASGDAEVNADRALPIIGITAVMSILAPLAPWPRFINRPWWMFVMYGWSAAQLALVGIAVYLDGGLESPVILAAAITLTSGAMAYPPGAVAALTVATTALPFVVGVASGDPLGVIVLIATMLGSIGVLAHAVAANHRDAYERLVLLKQRVENLAFEDALTGCHNHRSFHEHLEVMSRQNDRAADKLALALLDLDHFKAVNDVHGHPVGDRVLAAVGETLRSAVRDGDIVARIGGEEFAVLSIVEENDGARQLAERLQTAIRTVDDPLPTTASLGVAVMPDDAVTPDGLIEVADRLLYAAKRAGRDCIVDSSSFADDDGVRCEDPPGDDSMSLVGGG